MAIDDHRAGRRQAADAERAGRAGRRRRRAASTLTLAATFALLSGHATPGDEVTDLGVTRAALEKWVETRRVISQEKRDWALGREMLEERIDVVQREIDSFRQKIDDTQGSIAEADAKKLELSAENRKLQEASTALDEAIVTLEARTRRLIARLPDPIVEKVKPLTQQLPGDDGDSKLSLSQRFQNVIGILNEVDKFNRAITVTSEVRSFDDGTAAEVTALYVGIGQGYYASVNGRVAGYGTATDAGWTWTPADALAPAVLRAVSILQSEEVADFVSLPVDVTEGN
ncbi:MAG: DUF3450 family protein [Planctomycetes bacterium]|nr:DUF3450 family protein [Planctomycetota bacterium]